eukprot:scaffold254772_cov32-Tisochrysis_lutea.AAC.3
MACAIVEWSYSYTLMRPRASTCNDSQATFTDIWVVFDFVDLDLRKLIASPQTISVAHVQWIAHQILIALQYLHSAHVLHRDLKPANVRKHDTQRRLSDCSSSLTRTWAAV